MHQLTGTPGEARLGISLRGSVAQWSDLRFSKRNLLPQGRNCWGRFTDPPHLVKPHAAAPAMEG